MNSFYKSVSVLLVLALLLASAAQAQEPDPVVYLPTNEQGQVEFQRVYRLPDSTLSGSDIVRRARIWAAKAYGNSASVVQYYDVPDGRLILKGIMVITMESTVKIITEVTDHKKYQIGYTLTIEGRPGRYRATLGDMHFTGEGPEVPIINHNRTAKELGNNKLVARLTASSEYQVVTFVQSEATATLRSLNRSIIAQLAEKDW